MLLLLTQAHPFLEKPGAQVSQLLAESKHVAHWLAHFVHVAEVDDPDKMYPGLH